MVEVLSVVVDMARRYAVVRSGLADVHGGWRQTFRTREGKEEMRMRMPEGRVLGLEAVGGEEGSQRGEQGDVRQAQRI